MSEQLIGFPFITNIHTNIISQLNNIIGDRLYYTGKSPFINMVSGNKLKEKSHKILYLNTKYDGESIYKFYNPSFRPIAGIKDMSVEYKNKFGSVKKITINWFCSNKEDIEDLTPHFLTGGKSIYLEWGWDSSFSAIPNDLNNIRIGQVEIDSYEKNIKSTGQFDCVAGIITNFDVSLNRDGSYDCITEITTPGFLMEAISINNVSNSNKLTRNQLAMANFKTYLQSGKFYDDVYSISNKNDSNNPDWFVLANYSVKEKIKNLYINSANKQTYDTAFEFDEMFFKNAAFISWGYIEDVILGNNYNIIAKKGNEYHNLTSLNSIDQRVRNVEYLRSSDLYVCMIPQYNGGTLNANDLKITLTKQEIEEKNKINPDPSAIATDGAPDFEKMYNKTKFFQYNHDFFNYYHQSPSTGNNLTDNVIINKFLLIKIFYDSTNKDWMAHITNFNDFYNTILRGNSHKEFIPKFRLVVDYTTKSGARYIDYMPENQDISGWIDNILKMELKKWNDIAKDAGEGIRAIDYTFHVYIELIKVDRGPSAKLKNLFVQHPFYEIGIPTPTVDTAKNFLYNYYKLCNIIKSYLNLNFENVKTSKRIEKTRVKPLTLVDISMSYYWESWDNKSGINIGLYRGLKDASKKYELHILETVNEYDLISIFKAPEVFLDDDLDDLVNIILEEKKNKSNSNNTSSEKKIPDKTTESLIWKDKFTDANKSELQNVPTELKEYCKSYKGEIRKILVNSEFFRKTMLENDNIHNGLKSILNGISEACGNYFNFIMTTNPSRKTKSAKTNSMKNIETSWYVVDLNSTISLTDTNPDITTIRLTADGASPSIMSSFSIKTKVSNASAFSLYYSQHTKDIYSYGKGEYNLYYSLYKNVDKFQFVDELGYQNELETDLSTNATPNENPLVSLENSMKSDEQGILRKHVKLDSSFNYLYSFLPLYGSGYNYKFLLNKNTNNEFYLRGKEGMKIGLYNSLGVGIDTSFITGLIPIEIDLEMQGISGFRIGDCFKLNEVPNIYNQNGAFQIINISQNISNNNWTTKLTAGYRVISEIASKGKIVSSNAKALPYESIIKNMGVIADEFIDNTNPSLPLIVFAFMMVDEGASLYRPYGVTEIHPKEYAKLQELFSARRYNEAIDYAYNFANRVFWKDISNNSKIKIANTLSIWKAYILLHTNYFLPLVYKGLVSDPDFNINDDNSKFYALTAKHYNMAKTGGYGQDAKAMYGTQGDVILRNYHPTVYISLSNKLKQMPDDGGLKKYFSKKFPQYF